MFMFVTVVVMAEASSSSVAMLAQDLCILLLAPVLEVADKLAVVWSSWFG